MRAKTSLPDLTFGNPCPSKKGFLRRRMDARIVPDQVGDRRPGMTSVPYANTNLNFQTATYSQTQLLHRHSFAISPRNFARGLSETSRPPIRGRRECRAPDAP